MTNWHCFSKLLGRKMKQVRVGHILTHYYAPPFTYPFPQTILSWDCYQNSWLLKQSSVITGIKSIESLHTPGSTSILHTFEVQLDADQVMEKSWKTWKNRDNFSYLYFSVKTSLQWFYLYLFFVTLPCKSTDFEK